MTERRIGTHIDSHEWIVLLLVSNGELALGLLVLGGKVLELENWVIFDDCHGKFDIALCVLVAGLHWSERPWGFQWIKCHTHKDFSVIRKSGQCVVQGFVHFCRIALEKPTASY
jgi:hypothetical protein